MNDNKEVGLVFRVRRLENGYEVDTFNHKTGIFIYGDFYEEPEDIIKYINAAQL